MGHKGACRHLDLGWGGFSAPDVRPGSAGRPSESASAWSKTTTVTGWNDYKKPFCSGRVGCFDYVPRPQQVSDRRSEVHRGAVVTQRREGAKMRILKMLFQSILMLVVDQLGEAVTYTPLSTYDRASGTGTSRNS